jgi:hypothetical protein
MSTTLAGLSATVVHAARVTRTEIIQLAATTPPIAFGYRNVAASPRPADAGLVGMPYGER